MNDISSLQGNGRLAGVPPSGATRSDRPSGTAEAPETYAEPVDQVEISAMGQMLSSLDGEVGIRTEKVAQVRQQIADGTYLTEEKLSIAASRLMEALLSSQVA
ncbi:MAG: flagellar biosynthesis anti-sigma factor FlgM [Phycisphaerae bacterium]|nr:flagellar biosynthesis anti-sigma factor FlgM [Phycisphaerae bacterium]